MSASLRIYFCGSMRAGRQDVDLYGTLVEKLGQYGEVLTPFVADKSITHLGRKVDFISWTTKLMVTFVGGVELLMLLFTDHCTLAP